MSKIELKQNLSTHTFFEEHDNDRNIKAELQTIIETVNENIDF